MALPVDIVMESRPILDIRHRGPLRLHLLDIRAQDNTLLGQDSHHPQVVPNMWVPNTESRPYITAIPDRLREGGEIQSHIVPLMGIPTTTNGSSMMAMRTLYLVPVERKPKPIIIHVEGMALIALTIRKFDTTETVLPSSTRTIQSLDTSLQLQSLVVHPTRRRSAHRPANGLRVPIRRQHHHRKPDQPPRPTPKNTTSRQDILWRTGIQTKSLLLYWAASLMVTHSASGSMTGRSIVMRPGHQSQTWLVSCGFYLSHSQVKSSVPRSVCPALEPSRTERWLRTSSSPVSVSQTSFNDY